MCVRVLPTNLKDKQRRRDLLAKELKKRRHGYVKVVLAIDCFGCFKVCGSAQPALCAMVAGLQGTGKTPSRRRHVETIMT